MAGPKRGGLRLLSVLALLAASKCVAQQFAAEDDYDYGNDFYNGDDGYGDGGDGDDDMYYDTYGYYGDEDDQYYEYFGYYADDGNGGYDYDYGQDDYDAVEDCQFDNTGKPVLSNSTAACDIKIAGVDKLAERLPGGLDGVYKLTSCYNGRAQYTRTDSPAGEDRVLWYSNTFGDWDISKGTEPNENEILMYGGEMEHASVPLFVHSWHVGSDLLKEGTSMDEGDYLPITVKVSCADGKKFDPAKFNAGSSSVRTQSGPGLTAAEIDQKYKQMYEKYAKAEPSPTMNFTFVVLMVMTGLTIVLAIPYFLMKKRGGKGGRDGLGASFAQMLQASRKKSSGHMN